MQKSKKASASVPEIIVRQKNAAGSTASNDSMRRIQSAPNFKKVELFDIYYFMTYSLFILFIVIS